MVLRASECKHITADHWADIGKLLLKLAPGEELIQVESDNHEGGVTSCADEVNNVVHGFAKLARILAFNGDRYEHESMSALKEAIKNVDAKIMPKKEYAQRLQETAEKILAEKIEKDAAETQRIVEEEPNRKVIEVIGNHENSAPFREKLQAIEKTHDNFQFSTELEVIPIPGGKKDSDANSDQSKEEKKDKLLIEHGDLPMNDAKFVEEGNTDSQRKIFNLAEMAEKALGTFTSKLSASAQWQEKFQGLVTFMRKSKATAKTIYSELLYRAQQVVGIRMQEGNLANAENDLRTCKIAIKKLNRRKDKYEELLKELEEEKKIKPKKRKQATEAYERRIKNLDEQLKNLDLQLGILNDKAKQLAHHSHIFHTGGSEMKNEVLHYKTPEEKAPQLFTPEILETVTHVAYGHTHNPDKDPGTGTPIKGMNGKKIIVSNSGSMTETNMQVKVWNKELKKKEWVTDLTKLGVLLYVVKDGKVNRITSIGKLLEENMPDVMREINKIPKPLAGMEPRQKSQVAGR